MSNTEARKIARDWHKLDEQPDAILEPRLFIDEIRKAKLAGAYLALEARCAWKPIETAPKDGTPVILGAIKNSGDGFGLWLGCF